MKEWICREISTSTGDNENSVLMIETELIRCRDCKRRIDDFCMEFVRYGIKKNGFCDRAKRKDDETD